MTTLLALHLPFAVSLLVGFLVVDITAGRECKPPLLIRLFLGAGLGLGISAQLTFLSFLILNRLDWRLVNSLHGIVLAVLAGFWIQQWRRSGLPYFRLASASAVLENTIGLIFLLILMIPVWIQANYFPWGGWDAWSVWNFKARFFFLGQGHWQNIFDPVLWRSSPHYPLLLPLINVWGWAAVQQPNGYVPLFVSVLFTFLTTGLLWTGLHNLNHNRISFLSAALLLTNSFFQQIGVSQYCDIVTGYYTLASLFCLTAFLNGRGNCYALWAALQTGLLTFTKPEGTVAAFIIGIIGLVTVIRRNRILPIEKKIKFRWLTLALGLTFWPMILFNILYSPGNQTFINGFFSDTAPVTWYRIKMTLAFFLVEFTSAKWNGILLLLTAGVFLGGRNPWRKNLAVFPFFFAGYLGIIFVYYLMNTYFEIGWWLQVTLHRIIISLLPAAVMWVFAGIWPVKYKD